MCLVPPESLPVAQATVIAVPLLLRSEIRRAWHQGRRRIAVIRRIVRRRRTTTA
jgi:hypothetical protein